VILPHGRGRTRDGVAAPRRPSNFKERDLGEAARFLLPSLKLKSPPEKGSSAESRLHDFLMKNFGGYTAGRKYLRVLAGL